MGFTKKKHRVKLILFHFHLFLATPFRLFVSITSFDYLLIDFSWFLVWMIFLRVLFLTMVLRLLILQLFFQPLVLTVLTDSCIWHLSYEYLLWQPFFHYWSERLHFEPPGILRKFFFVGFILSVFLFFVYMTQRVINIESTKKLL